MPRSIFLSPDPKLNRLFKATLTIDGAVVGEEYMIACLTDGVISFDEYVLKITSVNEVVRRAELIFTSRDGFSSEGTFTIVIKKVDDPTVRVEKEVMIPPLLPFIKAVATATDKPSIVLKPNLSSVPVAKAVSTPVLPLSATPSTTPPIIPQLSNPAPLAIAQKLVRAFGIILVIILGVLLMMYFKNIPVMVATQRPSNKIEMNTPIPDPDSVINASDAEDGEHALEEDAVKQNSPEPKMEPEPTQAPATVVAPAAPGLLPTGHCGACP